MDWPTTFRTRGLFASVIACLLVVSLVRPAAGVHNLDTRKWDQQQSGIYNYAPRWFVDNDSPPGCWTAFNNAAGVWNARNRELRYVAGSGATVYIQVIYDDLAFPHNGSLAFSNLDAFTDITWQKINFNTDVDLSGGGRLHPYCGSGVPAADQYDFQSTAEHELGHNQIQNHTSALADVMYPTLAPGVTKRTLSQHDKDSFAALYAGAS